MTLSSRGVWPSRRRWTDKSVSDKQNERNEYLIVSRRRRRAIEHWRRANKHDDEHASLLSFFSFFLFSPCVRWRWAKDRSAHARKQWINPRWMRIVCWQTTCLNARWLVSFNEKEGRWDKTSKSNQRIVMTTRTNQLIGGHWQGRWVRTTSKHTHWPHWQVVSRNAQADVQQLCLTRTFSRRCLTLMNVDVHSIATERNGNMSTRKWPEGRMSIFSSVNKRQTFVFLTLSRSLSSSSSAQRRWNEKEKRKYICRISCHETEAFVDHHARTREREQEEEIVDLSIDNAQVKDSNGRALLQMYFFQR